MLHRCLFAVFVLISTGSVSGDRLYVKVGGAVRLKPDNVINTDLQSSITWKHKDDSGRVTKVIEFDSYDKTTESPNDKFRGHAELDQSTGELTLKDLKLEHSGLYTIEIRSKEQEKKFTLTVMEGVIKPQLKKEPTNGPINPDVLYLICEYNAMIRWTCSNEENPQTGRLDSPRQGEFLMFKRTGNPEVCCSCSLTNAVSQETSDPVCEKDVFPETANVGLVLGVLITLVLVIGIAVLYLCPDPFDDVFTSVMFQVTNAKL